MPYSTASLRDFAASCSTAELADYILDLRAFLNRATFASPYPTTDARIIGICRAALANRA